MSRARVSSVMTPGQAMLAFGGSLILVTGALELMVRMTTGASMASAEGGLLRLALFFVANDMAVGLVLMLSLLAWFQRPAAAPLSGPVPGVSMLIAAWNEADCIVDTVHR